MMSREFKDREQRAKEGITAVPTDMQKLNRQMLMFAICMITPDGANEEAEVAYVQKRMAKEKELFNASIDLADKMYDLTAERCGHGSNKLAPVASVIAFLSAAKRCREIMLEDEVYASMIAEAGL